MHLVEGTSRDFYMIMKIYDTRVGCCSLRLQQHPRGPEQELKRTKTFNHRTTAQPLVFDGGGGWGWDIMTVTSFSQVKVTESIERFLNNLIAEFAPKDQHNLYRFQITRTQRKRL